MKHLALSMITAAGASLLLGACGVSIGSTVYTEDHSYVLDGAQLNRLALDVGSGDVDIEGTDAKTVSVHEHLSFTKDRKPSPHHSVQGDTATLGSKCPDGITIGMNRCQVDYTLQLPKALVLQLKNGSGNVTLRTLAGDVEARLGSGNLTADGLAGAQNVLDTGSGNVRVTGGTGALDIRDASGNVAIYGGQSRTVRAHSESGNVRLEFGAAPSSVDAGSASGNVQITVPADQSYVVDATTSSGSRTVDVHSDSASSHRIQAHSDSGNVSVTN